MIWQDDRIRAWAMAGGLSPYEPDLVNPASVDLRWSGRGKLATAHGWVDFDVNPTGDDLQLEPGQLWLLDTVEYIKMPKNAGANLMLKSSIGRLGLEHLHAGWFDPDFQGTATLEIINVSPWPIGLAIGTPIVQLVLMSLWHPPTVGYEDTGRYNGQREPQTALPPRKPDIYLPPMPQQEAIEAINSIAFGKKDGQR